MDVSPPPAADAATPTHAPSLAWTDRGVVAAWVEGETVRVWQRRGETWAPLGPRLNERAPTGPVKVSRGASGAPAGVWSEAGLAGPAQMRFAQWDGSRWVQRPGPLNVPAPRATVGDFVVAWAGDTPIVSMIAPRQGAADGVLRSVRWAGMRWELAGPPSLISATARVQALATASCERGDALLAWVEVAPSGTPTLELRRWNAPRRHWAAMPRANAPLVDAGTRTLGLACGASGEALLAYGWSGGVHPVQRWDEAAGEWTPVGIGAADLAAASLESGPWITTRGDALWMTWRVNGGRLASAVRRGEQWRLLSAALDEPGSTGGGAVVGADGALYVSALAPSNPRMVAGFWSE